jgi:hypothetical protein
MVIVLISMVSQLLFYSCLESGGAQSEENKVSLEKDKKRRLKTPAQVIALEKFYNGMITSLVIFYLRLLAKCQVLYFAKGFFL